MADGLCCVRAYALWVIQYPRQPAASVAADFGALHSRMREGVFEGSIPRQSWGDGGAAHLC